MADAEAPISDDTEKKQRNLIPFKPGESGNPSGRPKGARSKLSETFISALNADFEQHGVESIQKVRETDPSGYVRVVASLLPKDFNLNATASEELLDALKAISARNEPG